MSLSSAAGGGRGLILLWEGLDLDLRGWGGGGWDGDRKGGNRDLGLSVDVDDG